MNMLKRTLAMFLVLCLLLGTAPLTAFAAETTEAEESTGGFTSMDFSDFGLTGTDTTATTDTGSESMDDVATYADTSNKPADGTTTSQPFPSGTGGSTYFRIPALVTLSNGDLVAAADARWTQYYDKGNIDTIVSRSSNKGSNWNYTFANYIDDGGNTYNISAATFIDPAMAVKTVDGVETIYMMVDLFPGQASGTTMCINAALAGTGMDSNGHLLVSNKNDNTLSDFNYYVGDYSDGVAPLCESDGTESGYTVDAYFNVYDPDNTCLGNLFTYGDTEGFYVYQTSYLYLTKSTDGGATWSAPTLINNQVKGSSEYFYGVGPASGFVTSSGRIMFTCYTYANSKDGNSSVIYSDDNGKTWTRSTDVSEQTSEAALTEADGTIYMFTRHGGYYYSTDNGTTWSAQQSISGISYTTDCELSVMTYSKEIDGQTAILLSAPTNDRTAGKIFVGLVNENKSITWKYTYAVNGSGTYQYSSLTELADGSIGLLYEDGAASITYANIAITDIVGADAVIGDELYVSDSNGVAITDLTIYIYNGAKELRINGLASGKTASAVSSDKSIATADVNGTTLTIIPLKEGTTTVTVKADDGIAVAAEDDVAADETVILNVTVKEFNTVDITLYEGHSQIITDKTGAWSGSYSDDAANVTWQGETVTTSASPVARLGTDNSFSGDLIDLNDCLYTFTENGDGTWYLSATTADGVTVYIDAHAGAGNGGYPNRDYTTDITLKDGTDGAIQIYDGVGHLHFWDNDDNKLYWDQCKDPDPGCSGHNLHIYKVADTTASTVLGGYYVQVTSVDSLVSGEKYLIVGHTNSGGDYAMHPSADYSNKYSHLAKITGGFGESTTTTTTEITITANQIETETASTSVTIGNTIYNITVLNTPDALTVDSTPFQAGTTDPVAVTKLTLSVGLTYDLNLAVTGSEIIWSVEDTSIATVDENGVVTAVGAGETTVTVTVDGKAYAIPVVVLDAPSASATTVTYDIYISEITNTSVYYVWDANTEYTQAQTGEVIYVAKDKEKSGIFFFGAPDDGYALTYMSSTNSAGEYYDLASGAFTEKFDDNFVVNDMVAAMTALGCDGGMGFTRVNSNANVASSLKFSSDALPTVDKSLNGVLPVTIKAAEFRRYTGKEMIATVGEYVYFTITVTQDAPVEFDPDKTGTDADGNALKYSLLTYADNNGLVDQLSGAYFYTKALDEADGDVNGDGYPLDGIIKNSSNQLTAQDISDALNAGWTQEQLDAGYRVLEYYVVYPIQADDVNTDIKNTVALDYSYTSKYSKATASNHSEEVAQIHVIGAYPGIFVIDFGQSFSITDDKDHSYAFKNVDVSKTNSSYGIVTKTENTDGTVTLTYTPTSILQGEDAVILYDSNGELVNGFRVFPATSVYYEEGFMFTGTSNDWTTTNAKMATATQATENLGSHVYNYGYDPIYAENSVTKSWAETKTLGATTTFTFTGTGFELYANCTEGSGYVSVRNKNTGDVVKVNKLFMIDTAVDFGKTEATTGQTGDFDTLPIVSVKDLDWNTYEVTIVKTHDSEPIYIDGVRIINTIEDSTIFTADKEDNPAFYQLRDMLLNAMAVGAGTDVESERYGTAAEMAQQVYDQSAAATGLITFEEIDYSANIPNGETAAEAISLLADLLDNGPKNELFLYAGNTFTFKVTTNRALQIGLKAPQADVEYSVTCKYTDTNGDEQDVAWKYNTEMVTSADMYYELGNPIGTEYTYTVTISVTEGILSITDLKICDDPNATFEPLTVEDIEKILIDAGYPAEETPEDTTPSEPEETEPEEETTVDRLAGANRFDTAMVIADQMKENLGIEKFDAIIVASGTSFADALAGSYLASVKNAPILLTYTTDAVNDSVKAYIQLNLNEGGTLYILGGETAVPASMETGMDAFVVKRLNGTDRFSTNLAILKEAGVDGKDILVCTGLDFADSLSASASKLPILLVWKDLTKDQKAFLETLDGSKLYIIGGKNAVDGKLEKQLEKYGEVIRIGGRNRFETSVLIAETFFKNPESAVLAYAWNYPDGLCGGTLASSSNAPLVLTMTDYESAAAEYISTHGIGKGTVLGGDGLISDNSVKTIFRGRGK